MKKLIVNVLVSTVIITAFTGLLNGARYKAFSPSVKQSDTPCNRALENVRSRIQNDRHLSVEWQTEEIPSYWQESAPAGRPYRLTIILGKPRERSYQLVRDILASTQMLTAMTNQLIDACDDVSLVTYGLWGSGELRTFGLINGTVREFEYVGNSDSEPTQLRWGVEYSN